MASSPPPGPGIARVVSDIGRNANFGSPEEEVDRIIRNKQNFYIVLKVMKDTDPSEIRTNYLKLNRLVHPDKCHHPQAAEASAVVNSAKDTLTNPIKKRLYDAYVTDVMSGRAEAGAEMSYADWEAAQAQYPVKIPAWLEMVLRIPVVGQIFALILLLILLPLVLILIVLILVLWIICLPINIVLRCLFGPPPMDAEAAQANAAFAQAAHQPPPHATAQRGPGNV